MSEPLRRAYSMAARQRLIGSQGWPTPSSWTSDGTVTKDRAMFDSLSATFADRRSDAAGTLPWRLVVLLVCFATLSGVLAILYPEVFGTPVEHF
jgi:hypothetical protein